MSAVDAEQSRRAWIDYARGVGIVLVVFGHANRSFGRSGELATSEWLRFADEVIYSFHMPLFFVLAGVVAGLTRNGKASVWGGLVYGIVLPYVIWTTVWVGLKVLLPGAVNHPLGLSDLVMAVVVPVEHFWFLYHLLFVRLIYLARPLAGDSASGVLATVLITFVAASVMGGGPGSLDALGYFASNVGFFGLGLLFAMAPEGRLPSGVTPISVVTAGSLAALFALAFFMLRPTGVSPAAFVVAAFGVAAVVAMVRLMPPPRGWLLRGLAFLGEASLAIYLIHLLVIAIVRAGLKSAGMLSEFNVVTMGTVLGLAVPALAYAALLALSASSGRPLTRWAGLGTATRSHYLPAITRRHPFQPHLVR